MAKNPVGRPTKYKSEFCQKIIDFFDVEPYKDIEIEHYKNGEIAWVDKKRMANKLPTLIMFSKSINVYFSTVYDWIDEKSATYHKEFREAFLHAKQLQKNVLIQGAIMGLYNPIFAKFTAVNLTDMRDKKEVEQNINEKREILIKVDSTDLQEKVNLVKRLKDADIERIDSQTIN